MSETKDKLGKKEELADIELKDLDVIDRFFGHFELDTPQYLAKAIEEYKSVQDLKTEKNLKLNLLKAVIDNRGKVEGLDDLFTPVINAAGEMAYNLQFDKDLEDVLTQEDPSSEESPAVEQAPSAE